jgi:dTDP-4-dehydrorhamnose reductase
MGSGTDHDKYLVTGARGMLGQAVLAVLSAQGQAARGVDLPEMDLTDPAVVRRVWETERPTHVIHCAAYTNVDGAESDVELCTRVNVQMPELVARACARTGARMLMIGTDFVFDGQVRRPYRETDPTGPLSVYGRTKLEGEQAAAAVLEALQIARTAWLFGPGKRNFVSAMIERMRKGIPLRVVDDQWGSPTYTSDLAPRLVELSRLEVQGVFHLVNGGMTTWYGLTRKAADLAGFSSYAIEAIDTASYPLPAHRPAWSVLDCSRAWSLGVTPMRDWTEALAEYVRVCRNDLQYIS